MVINTEQPMVVYRAKYHKAEAVRRESIARSRRKMGRAMSELFHLKSEDLPIQPALSDGPTLKSTSILGSE